MKKVAAFAVLLVCAVAAFASPFKKVWLEVDGTSTFTLPEITNDFGFVSMFYESICYNFGLMDMVQPGDLLDLSVKINACLKNGRKVRMTVKKYDGRNDLIFNFGTMPYQDSILVTSNYDMKLEKVIPKDGFSGNTFALLYCIVDGHVISIKKIHSEAVPGDDDVIYANDMMFDGNVENDSKVHDILEAQMEKGYSPIIYIIMAQCHFNDGRVDEGLALLDENRETILSSGLQDDIESIFLCTYEEGRALSLIYAGEGN